MNIPGVEAMTYYEMSLSTFSELCKTHLNMHPYKQPYTQDWTQDGSDTMQLDVYPEYFEEYYSEEMAKLPLEPRGNSFPYSGDAITSAPSAQMLLDALIYKGVLQNAKYLIQLGW